jgi:hypothetical protein
MGSIPLSLAPRRILIEASLGATRFRDRPIVVHQSLLLALGGGAAASIAVIWMNEASWRPP